jgi:uncharacterized tellurite resistance protein B-like protein
MFDALSRLFSRETTEVEEADPKLSVAALLVHLTAVDGVVTEDEKQTLRQLMMEHYKLSESDVRALIRLAVKKDHEAVDYYRFTAEIARLTPEEKVDIIRMMWRLVYVDAENHELEDNMVWRVAELIGISARERTILRNQIRRETEAEMSAEDDDNSAG